MSTENKNHMVYTDPIINALFLMLAWFRRYGPLMHDQAKESAPTQHAAEAIYDVLAQIESHEGKGALLHRMLFIEHAQLAELCVLMHEFIDNHSINSARHDCGEADHTATEIERFMERIGFYSVESGEPAYIRQNGRIEINPQF